VVEVMTPAALRIAAVAAREDARMLRAVSGARRAALRRSCGLSRRRLRTCSTTFASLNCTRDLRYRSAWSDLQWQLPDRDLDRVLVPIEGRSA